MGLAASVFVYWVISLVRMGKSWTEQFGMLLRSLGLVLITVTSSVVVFPGFYLLSIFGGQTVSYRSWTRFDTYADKFGEIVSFAGPVWFVLLILSFVFLMFTALRRSDARKMIAEIFRALMSVAVWALVAQLAFWQVQDFSAQHWYVLMTPLLVLLVAPPLLVTGWMREKYRVFARVTICVASFASLLSGVGFHFPQPISEFLPLQLISIKREADYDQKRDLVALLAKSCGEGERVYFAAASSGLNSTLVQSVRRIDRIDAGFDVLMSDVDLRDGFNTSFFDAEYVVTSDPVQIHMKEENERVVSTLNSLVRNGSGYVGSHYEVVESFDFSDGVEVTVHRRTSDFTDSEVHRLQSVFDGFYPDKPELFHDRFEDYLKGESDDA